MRILNTRLLIQRLLARGLYRELLGGGVFVLVVISLSLVNHHQLYTINAADTKLVGKASVDISRVKATAKLVSYNATPAGPTLAKSTTVAGPTDAAGKTGYKATINTDFAQGMSFGDSNSDLGFTLTPLFSANAAEYKNGQVMFPVSGSTKIFQTLKKNGVKEDIVLTQVPGKTASWQWKLGLGSKLSAKLMPDGSVGVFAANPNLYGDIQINDAKSQSLIDKARTNDKSYEIFDLPAPFIKNAKGQTLSEDVSFKLVGDTLTLEARNLKNQHYPISIDPSVVITTTADFATGTDDGTIDYSTANQIGRGAVSLGTVGVTTVQTTAFTTARQDSRSVAYNGFLYITGGDSGAAQSDIQFATMNSNGSLSCPAGFTCTGGTVFAVNATGFTSARYAHTSVAYNGYLYIIGGQDSGVPRYNDAQYCPINSNGSVGACTQQTNAFTTARDSHTSVVYNGFVYIIGGEDASSTFNDIQFSAIDSDGSLSCPIGYTCTGGTVFTVQAAAFTGVRDGHTTVVYNGNIYIAGGENNAGTAKNDIIHCPLNRDGSVGTCVQQLAAFTTARIWQFSVAYDGYLYIIAGQSGTPTELSDVQYCPINSDASVGACTTSGNSITTGRDSGFAAVYNGYIYVLGGNNGTIDLNDAQYLHINTGTPSGFGTAGTTTTNTNYFSTPRYSTVSVAYNGYLYVMGGHEVASDFNCKNGVSNSYCNDIQYAAINSDGSIGTFTTNTNYFSFPRESPTSVAYNGYLYVIGGYEALNNTTCKNAGTSNYCNDIQYAAINSDGSVGTFTTNTNYFSIPREYHASVAYNGYLYVIGGDEAASNTSCKNAGTSSYCNDIQYAAINSDGSIGSFTTNTNYFSIPRYAHTSVAYNGYLYVIGGEEVNFDTNCKNAGTSSECNDIQYAAINSDGSVGTFTTSANHFSFTRAGHSSVAYNGYLYVMGGQQTNSDTNCKNGGTSSQCNDIQYAAINSDGSIGTFTTNANYFGIPRAYQTSVVSNGYVYVMGGYEATSDTNCKSAGTSSDCDDIQYVGIKSPAQAAHYERVIDTGGVAASIDSIQYNGTAKCGAKVQYATAGSSGIFGSLTTLWPDDIPGTTYALAGQTSKRFIRVVVALNDQNCGGTSNVTDITVNYTAAPTPPAAPTLSAPASGAVNVSTLPVFTLKTTDGGGSVYARYKIIVYQSDCSTVVRTIDETASQTGWSGQDAQVGTAYVMGSTLAASTLATHTYQAAALSLNTTYCWKAAGIDPGGSNTFGSFSATQLFSTNQIPAAPTLVLPRPSQTGVSTLPVLRMDSIDADSDYLLYKIDVCSTSNCSSIVRTIDETASQTGWTSQSLQSATAYASGQEAVHTYQAAGLTANTQYWWRAFAIDPAGNNAFSAASSIGTFTTAPTTQINVNIGGGTSIYGGTTIGQ